MGAKSSIKEYAIIGFLLLGVLFGMNIMTFIFGSIGPEDSGLTAYSEAYNISAAVQNQSLQSIKTYAAGSVSQFSTLSLAITVLLLIGLFLVIWNIFTGEKKGRGSSGANFQ